MWKVEFVSDSVEQELRSLSRDLQAKFLRIAEMIEANGLEKMREPYVKHLEGKLWEMRLQGKDRIARSLYVTAIGKRVVVVRTFVKKTQTTPRREIELALIRAEEVR
jgi:phage-related protein